MAYSGGLLSKKDLLKTYFFQVAFWTTWFSMRVFLSFLAFSTIFLMYSSCFSRTLQRASADCSFKSSSGSIKWNTSIRKQRQKRFCFPFASFMSYVFCQNYLSQAGWLLVDWAQNTVLWPADVSEHHGRTSGSSSQRASFPAPTA